VDLRPEPIPLHVLYEDDDLIVLNKQANIIVHPARKYRSGTLINALAYHFQNRSGGELSGVGKKDERPGVVHRLDMNTTGVIIFAKQDATHWLLAKQFEERTNLKAYLALVHGCPNPPQGAIDQPIGKHPTIREAYAVRHDPSAKDCLTLYRVRRQYEGYSLVELELKSGRTHQIRVHLSHLGHPIVGDQLYGGEMVGPPEIEDPPEASGGRPGLNFARPKAEGLRFEELAKERVEAGELIMGTPALHAALLRIKHPATGKSLTFSAPLHEPMMAIVRTLEAEKFIKAFPEAGTHVNLSTCAEIN
jgi:23S rRNA pseudouridine1911/1915/1917 synthase